MAELHWEPPSLQEQMADQASPPKQIIEKESGQPVECIRDLVNPEASSEQLAYILGYLVETMFDRRLLTAQEVIDITGSWRWYEVEK